ncbi:MULTISPECIES: glutathione S-transferase family protein [Pseudovibrio]|uniref:glutathione S-transferase family protein n=1 Tax=Stappiaceae TaxID=2821832 RepID=UPI0023660CC6|nr:MULTISPECIES: glutathione S-transferase family protein [Pseudovibrio]MDD7909816.1 glutathione S-transferase family protein [Pseudovibrio exalbescens]MDX5592156.1 glutathione S-transferase family protein [Pseudovibrio sp. SPO723]
MLKLYHHPFCPHSRAVRLALGEYGVQFECTTEYPWVRRQEFLMLNPAGTIPVLHENDGGPVCGTTVILEYLDETRGYSKPDRRLLPDHPVKRAEVRRLVDWFLNKFHVEVLGYLVHERIYKQEMAPKYGGGQPDSAILRVARTNMGHHLQYIGYLAATRKWLAGDELSFADLAAAAMLSTADYLGEVPWARDENTKSWYARVKSRPSFRPLLSDKMLGMPPSATYADLDF